MAEELQKLVRRRGSIKAKFTVFKKFIENLEVTCPHKKISDMNVILDLEDRLNRARVYIDNFDEIQGEIDLLADVDQAEQLAEREEFEKGYSTFIAKARAILIMNQPAACGNSTTADENGASVNPGTSTVEFKNVKLPVIDLPKFDGDANQWLGFRDTFESLIHARTDISDIQKFHYLKAAAGSNLAETFENLEFSSANYADAWKSLCDRFNDTNLLIDTHIKAIYHLEKVTCETSTALRKVVDVITNRLKALKNLGKPTEHWGDLVKFMVLVKLHESTIDKWDEQKISFKHPTLENLLDFLKARANSLQTKETNKEVESLSNKFKRKSIEPRSNYKSFVTTDSKVNESCKFCKSVNHYVANCPEFMKLTASKRAEQVRAKGLCINCLRSGHFARDCRSGSCRTCKQRHHTLLHLERPHFETARGPQDENVALTSRNTRALGTEQTLLSTFLARIVDGSNKTRIVRGLLDVGSQTSFITSKLAKSLGIKLVPTQLTIGGINGAHSEINYKCSIHLHSVVNEFSLSVGCFVIPKITGMLPNFRINKGSLVIPSHIKLADPNFHVTDEIDLLIGADHFYDILCTGQYKLAKHGPTAQKTRFGWVIGGPIQSLSVQTVYCGLARHDSLEQQVSRFWEIEEFPDSKPWSHEEKLVETHFQENTTRHENGKFIVAIPLRIDPSVLGVSSETAERRFLNLERKFAKNLEFRKEFCNFMDEYKRLGHMTKVEDPESPNNAYYMPLHGVLKETSTTTKLRVVFDSSCPSSSGYSSNDLQMVGPTIQSDLFSILTLFRKHVYVVVGDIEKMYRMCIVKPEQRFLQRIFWRDNPHEPLSTYELTTVTYGTSAAAFLAIRCLYQLGLECDDAVVADVIKTQFYVDDMLTGAATKAEASHIANEVSRVLQKGGFRLRKFISNSPDVLKDIRDCNESSLLNLGANENTRTLGMLWSAKTDCFLYKINLSFSNRTTKRVVLSESSQIFDSLGLLSPTIILAKILLRDIWIEKIDWDDSLPLTLHTRWLDFRNELTALQRLEIPRRVVRRQASYAEIHAFSDASTKAYGSCVYMRSRNDDGNYSTHLICAKSKVCPVKVQTVPRLELMAALLMCRLVKKVRLALKMKIVRVVYWTDSSVTLGWIRTPLNLLQVFVANRVGAIQELSQPEEWRHVPTECNPADFISRGVNPSALVSLDTYWNGPSWLPRDEKTWPSKLHVAEALPDLKAVSIVSKVVVEKLNLFENYSSLSKLERVVAYCLRWLRARDKSNKRTMSDPLQCREINRATEVLVKMSQRESFESEIQSLVEEVPLDKRSRLMKLNPFLDEHGILRVGGRLAYAPFSYSKRYPMVLCSKSPFAKMLFNQTHRKLMHAGPSLLLAHTRSKYWTLLGRNLARKTVYDCVTCFRARPKAVAPMMGNLPIARLTPAPPFSTSGVDYAGPFRVKDRQGRGCKVTKAYMCLFVCFVTRAVHIELVSDLTSAGFIAAFRRFVSRRGRPTQIFSDNGTNFVGANSELEELGRFLANNSRHLSEVFENEGVNWSFIPPHSPHFGGLWEAGVKSAKAHLMRVAANALLTYEQFYTLLVQIEGILNSRPMHPMSSDPSDLQPLTPSHFLIGRAMTSLPDPPLLDVPENRLKAYQRVQQLQQHFWSRWALEYVSELQHTSSARSGRRGSVLCPSTT